MHGKFQLSLNGGIALGPRVHVLLSSWFQFHQLLVAVHLHRSRFLNTLYRWRNALQLFAFGLGNMNSRSHTIAITAIRAKIQHGAYSGGIIWVGGPNPPLNSDPACIAFRSLSCFRYLGFVQRLGAGVAG